MKRLFIPLIAAVTLLLPAYSIAAVRTFSPTTASASFGDGENVDASFYKYTNLADDGNKFEDIGWLKENSDGSYTFLGNCGRSSDGTATLSIGNNCNGHAGAVSIGNYIFYWALVDDDIPGSHTCNDILTGGGTIQDCRTDPSFISYQEVAFSATAHPAFINTGGSGTALSQAGQWSSLIFRALGDGGTGEMLAGIAIGALVVAALVGAIKESAARGIGYKKTMARARNVGGHNQAIRNAIKRRGL